MMSATIHIFDEFMILALDPEQHGAQLSSGTSAPDAYVTVQASQPDGPDRRFGLMQLIDDFCTRLGLACDCQGEDQQRAVVLAENSDGTAMSVASMLLGSFLILRQRLSVSSVVEAFQDAALHDRFVPLLAASAGEHAVTVHDCWRALGHALRLGWLMPPSSDDEPVLDVDELAHYARAANGGVQIVVPGALLLFPTPHDGVPEGAEWADSVAADGSAARGFSAGFYASLLADLGVSAAACLTRTSAASARAFAARGVDPADLRFLAPARAPPGPGALLPALDRLLSLARAVPGGVAVHCGSVRAGWPGPGSPLGVMAAAFLISRCGFSGAEAAAWVHMVAPPNAPPLPPQSDA